MVVDVPEDDNRSVVQIFHLEHPQPPFRSTPILGQMMCAKEIAFGNVTLDLISCKLVFP